MSSKDYIQSYCVGCGLCHAVNGTEFQIDDKGFPIPSLPKSMRHEFFEKVCPVYYYGEESQHDVWGQVDKAYVGYSSDSEVRYKAASGGALTELCVYLLESKKVDGILHTTFNPEHPTENISVVSTTAEEVRCRCGSRYSISVPLYEMMEITDISKRYAFVGKPCDVMALRRFLSIQPELNATFPYLLSFFCAGEPSPNAQDNLLKRMNCKHEECRSITYRGNGWPGYTTIEKTDGVVEKLEYKIAWGSYLGRDLRNICRFCLDGTGDAADIVCADFWYLDAAGNPDFSEHKGRNIIISRNQKGSILVANAIEDGKIVVELDFTDQMGDLKKYQPAQYKRKGTMRSMILAMRLCGRSTPKYSRSYLKLYASHMAVKMKCRYFLGIIKRVVQGRI